MKRGAHKLTPSINPVIKSNRKEDWQELIKGPFLNGLVCDLLTKKVQNGGIVIKNFIFNWAIKKVMTEVVDEKNADQNDFLQLTLEISRYCGGENDKFREEFCIYFAKILIKSIDQFVQNYREDLLLLAKQNITASLAVYERLGVPKTLRDCVDQHTRSFERKLADDEGFKEKFKQRFTSDGVCRQLNPSTIKDLERWGDNAGSRFAAPSTYFKFWRGPLIVAFGLALLLLYLPELKSFLSGAGLLFSSYYIFGKRNSWIESQKEISKQLVTDISNKIELVFEPLEDKQEPILRVRLIHSPISELTQPSFGKSSHAYMTQDLKFSGSEVKQMQTPSVTPSPSSTTKPKRKPKVNGARTKLDEKLYPNRKDKNEYYLFTEGGEHCYAVYDEKLIPREQCAEFLKMFQKGCGGATGIKELTGHPNGYPLEAKPGTRWELRLFASEKDRNAEGFIVYRFFVADNSKELKRLINKPDFVDKTKGGVSNSSVKAPSCTPA